MHVYIVYACLRMLFTICDITFKWVHCLSQGFIDFFKLQKCATKIIPIYNRFTDYYICKISRKKIFKVICTHVCMYLNYVLLTCICIYIIKIQIHM